MGPGGGFRRGDNRPGLVRPGLGGLRTVALLYLLMVVGAAFRLSRWPVFAAAACGALLWDFLFIPPSFTFYIREPHDAIMCLMLFVVAQALGHFTTACEDVKPRSVSGTPHRRVLEMTNKTALAPNSMPVLKPPCVRSKASLAFARPSFCATMTIINCLSRRTLPVPISPMSKSTASPPGL